ncbi:uncharacterized protein EURHEDRAFT_519300 [Aspergillus ruber CBS 135680]|uniref:Uncharacterized protein n=1 Tax=Aspergillus ruber (strain CBS 135680) TaxID=1388766 RepID=A0A017S056_ASPRC|nr:uncharacterized protein EURHEDRAFT_519300 [Aspergillus ruber CBS 135680]EYE90221.1 hypothetical protein EURHEDRAFT_519300 [Aspergillus ruber CBS 135680]
MRIIDPQSATLSNIEVLAHITSHPPRRPPNPPPNTNPRNFTPSPDLRDHNTVIKEIHNYVSRLSPHLLSYPQYVHEEEMKRLEEMEALVQGPRQGQVVVGKGGRDLGPTEMDKRLGGLVKGLKPFGLTKGEVLVILNLGVGFLQAADGGEGQGEGEGEEQMEVDQGQGEVNGEVEGEGQEEGEGELPAEDYGALALLDTVIEEREERLSNEDVAQVLAVIREALGPGSS